MNVCMLVTTSITTDPRVMKEAIALAQVGHSVHVIGARTLGTEMLAETYASVTMLRLDLWHVRLVRWIKARRGLSPLQGTFSSSSQRDSGKLMSKVKGRLINVLHQAQDAIHVFTVTWAFAFAALRQPADVYHAHDIDALLPTVLAGRLRRKPIVYDAHEYTLGPSGRNVSHAIYQWIERTCVGDCAHVFTVNRSIAEEMAKHYHIAVPTVLMNVPGNAPVIQPPPLRDGQPIELLFHGNFQAHRGLETLVAAIALVKTPVHLTLRGYGELELSLRAQIKSMGLEGKVAFAPVVPLNQVVQTSVGCHVGVISYEKIPAFIFSLPNKLFEYMAAGLAILANDLPEIAAIVREHKLGSVYEDANDPTVLAQAIEQLISDRERLEGCRQRAWQVYHEHYTWQRHQQVLLKVYERLGAG